MRIFALSFAVVLAAGCARPPGALRGSFALLTPQDVQQQETPPVGERVRWGGEIVSTHPGKGETCLEVVSKPLDRAARPTSGDANYGRFIACAKAFYDPAVYAPQREVTVVGTLAEPVYRKVGEYEYRFPRVEAEVIHLWPRPPEYVYAYPYYDPFWGPGWGPWWGWGWGGYFAAPVRRPPVKHPHR